MSHDDSAYIDYETFLDPSFSSIQFANKLVLSTNDPNDYPQDLATPLSKVLFDVQEIDTHIDTLTSKSALPLLEYTNTRAKASEDILQEIESQVDSLKLAYQTLQREVVERYENAESVKRAAERLNQTLKLAHGVRRALVLGRQLEIQMSEYSGAGLKKSDFRAMLRAANTLATLKTLLMSRKPGEEGYGLEKVLVINTLTNDFILSSERQLIARSQQIIREFSMSSLILRLNAQSASTPTFSQNEETKARTVTAISNLYLLSSVKPGTVPASFEPTLALAALQDYLQTALRSSIASLSRSLATIPTLDKTLVEVSARCQNIVALERLLASITPPSHPAFDILIEKSPEATSELPSNLLEPLLSALDTSSLPSYFWRSLASSLSPRVQEILSKGGVSARTLKANKDGLRESIRACVDRGSQIPESYGGPKRTIGNSHTWEREATVMVASVVGPLGR